MKTKRTLTIAATLVALASLPALGVFRGTQSVWAESKVSSWLPGLARVVPALPVPTPNYTVLPSDTDGHPADADGNQPDCPGTGIGCEAQWGELALNHEHFFYLPPAAAINRGKLLVFLGGGNGSARAGGLFENLYPVAARQGYYVLGLTYPAGETNGCSHESTRQEKLQCFGEFMTETITGSCAAPSPAPGCERSDISEHSQDSVINRLVKALQ